MTEYENTTKQTGWESYWEGYKFARDVETYDDTDRKVAKSNFERMWTRNYE
jgi:hypothetical protein